MVEGSHICAIADFLLARNCFELAWVVEPLEGGVAVPAVDSVGSGLPAAVLVDEHCAVFGAIFVVVRRSSEVLQSVGVNSLRPVVFLTDFGTP